VCVNEDEHICELSLEASKLLDDVKTNVQYRYWDKQQGNLFTVVAASGVLTV
jgi:hypothetical protein